MLHRTLLPSLLAAVAGFAFAEPYKIELIDAENGWPVPLVELSTTHNLSWITDNAGVVAVDAPELMGRETWFHIRGDGYQVAKDGFGYRGVRLTPIPGGSTRVKIGRRMIAKRLGRLTGGGLFAESQKLGEQLGWEESGVFGCDSVLIAPYRGRQFWAWGDTTLPRYPLGVFHTTSATTPLEPLTSFEPPVALQFDYFRDAEQRPRAVAKLPGEGPTWISAYASLPDSSGEPHLVGTYSKIRGFLEAYRIGLCAWSETSASFESLRVLWEKSPDHPAPPMTPQGHPIFWKDGAGDRWLMFGDPFPSIRMPATFEAWQDPQRWEALTPQRNVAPADGEPAIKPHRGSVAWSGFRHKWVAVFTQQQGKPSPLGEIWYAEAEQPTGPWENAVKVLSHENYSFYNPRLHADFTPEDSPILLFEGTYTSTFSNNPNKTPRYDYNQILYRIDLDDPRLVKALRR